LYKFVLTSILIYAVLALKPKTWKQIPRIVREQRRQAERRRQAKRRRQGAPAVHLQE
jgi:hypothetical protein